MTHPRRESHVVIRIGLLCSGLCLLLAILAIPGTAEGQSEDSYLPLKPGYLWTLRHPGVPKATTFEVLAPDGNGFRIRFDSPFGVNDWTLVPQDGKFILVKYGKDGQMMNLPVNQVLFDFTARKDHSWTIVAGKMALVDRDAVTKSASRTYDHAIRFRQGKNLSYTFAQGVGFVQFGEGKDAFVLDEGSSRLPGGAPADRAEPNSNARRPPPEQNPVSHVPGPSLSANAVRPSPLPSQPAPSKFASGQLRVGITIDTFANEAQNPGNLLKHWQETVDAGVTFIASNGKWDELETKNGQYNLDSLNFQVSEAQKHNMEIAYTLRLIDTVDRAVPPDLRSKKWTDPALQSRVLDLISALAPVFKDRVKWFMFGNEIDGYFGRHPDEIQGYASLYGRVSRRLKELVPGIRVSSTLMYGGVDSLRGALQALNSQFDFLAFTYYPIHADFTMRDPDVVTDDFQRMGEESRGRGVVLQEIGYASSSVNGSSQEKQGEFIRNVFAALRADRTFIEAGNFFLMGDLADKSVKALAGFYGMPNAKTFLAFLQTTGLYDLQGRPKLAWFAFASEMKRP